MRKKEVSYSAYPLELIHGPMPELKEADIIFVHDKKSFLRYLIRRVTKSYWDHVALVLFAKDLKKGRFYDHIIEAVEPRGVQVHKLEKYLLNPERYDVGIKRVNNISDEVRKRIVTFMLTSIDAPYYSLSRVQFFIASYSIKFAEKLLGRQRFCGSGFVQKAFYASANWDNRADVIFKLDEFYSPMELQDTTTVADIARSINSTWIYNKRYV